MILMNDFRAQPEELLQAEMDAVEKVIRSGWYILGKEVEKFESAWGKLCDVIHVIGVGNGMDALEIGIRILLEPGDEVITTPMTAFATILAIIRAGATPVLADVNPETALLDIDSVKRCISSSTKAILLVHLYGQIREMEQWKNLCDNNNLYLLEDCAQAHMASWNQQAAGTFGCWGAYSFYPTKNLGTTGDGGALITSSEDIAQQAKILRNYGQTKRYYHDAIGLNSRLDELHAAILSVRLQWLKKFTAKRQQIAKTYYQEISNPLIKLLSKPIEAENHVYHLFVVLCTERDRLRKFLLDCKIDNQIHYPVPIHQQKPCMGIKRDSNGLKKTEYHANHCLSLPCHPQLSDDEIKKVIRAVNQFK
jgi:dTDP-4-amino-4,6-dideoxygalactose transaminase